MLKTTIITLAFGLLSLFGYSQDHYYYAFNQKVHLKPSKTKMLVCFKTPQQIAQLQQIAQRSRTKCRFKSLDYAHRTYMLELPDAEGMASFKRQFKTQLASANPVYLNKDGGEMGMTNEFMVRFKPGVSPAHALTLHRAFGVKLKKATVNYWLLEVPVNADVLTIANAYQESGLVEFAHPNFMIEAIKTSYLPNDPYFAKQFYLHNTGQEINNGRSGKVDADIDAPEAWDITKGNANITVAVIDAGVTSNHPDLPNSSQLRLKGSNFASSVDGTNPDDPSPKGNNNHGNACAGIIAATQDNNKGITGIAPNVKVMPIRITFGGKEPANLLVDAVNFAWQNGADIISNSWGLGDRTPNAIPALVQAFRDATTKGREGKGCIVFIAASNSADQKTGDKGFVSFPANIEVPGVLTVGASDRYDKQANYSPSSNPISDENQLIDIVAPSHRRYHPNSARDTGFEIWTLDIPGNRGYNGRGDNPQLPSSGRNHLAYTGHFGGTSASTPVAAGVAALMLSLNPNLTKLQVYDILTQSADKVGGYAYNDGKSDEMGYGRVNAFEALKATQNIGSNCNVPTFSVQDVNKATANIVWPALNEAKYYTIRYRSVGTPSWTRVKVLEFQYTLNNLTGGTSYEVQMRSECVLGKGAFSSSVIFTTLDAPDYCVVRGLGANNSAFISQVTLGSINHASGNDNGYGDFTALSTNLVSGASANLQVSRALPATVPPGIPLNFVAWIDFNQDGDFSDDGEQVLLERTMAASVSNALKVPIDAKPGATRMRIIVTVADPVPAPCDFFIVGAIEDYTVNIVAPATSGGSIATIGLRATIYPNPTSQKMNINLNSTKRTEVDVRLMDKDGKTVMHKHLLVVPAGLTESFQVNHLKKGLYYMSIQTKEGYKKIKRVILK